MNEESIFNEAVKFLSMDSTINQHVVIIKEKMKKILFAVKKVCQPIQFYQQMYNEA